MKITLDLVRGTLRQALGRESFIASFITRVEETASYSTACITQDGQLHINPEFVDTYVSSEQDLVCILLHEILHPRGNRAYNVNLSITVAAYAWRKRSGSPDPFPTRCCWREADR